MSFSFGRKESDRKSDMAEKSPKERERNEKEKKTSRKVDDGR